MTKDEFKSLTEKGRIYLDGATGSNLQRRGMPSGVCPDLWISENPETLIGLQLEFLREGSRIIYAPTFTANAIKLSEFGLKDRLNELNKTLVAESIEARERFYKERPDAESVYIAGDLTMTGRSLKPVGDLDFEELIDVYKEQIAALVKAGVDLIVVETMMSLQETRAAVIACKESCELPVITTLTFEGSGKTLFGTDPLTALITLQSLGVSAFGINCSMGPYEMEDMFRSIIPFAEVPLICKPNAGLPELDKDGNTVYNLNPEDFATGMERIAALGVRLLGGCCGTTPEHIRALIKHTSGISADSTGIIENAKKKYVLTSERSTLSFGLDDRFFIIGERINPTGKKALQAELKEGSFDMVLDFAEEQEKKGAKVLDINMGMSGVDEKALMLTAIEKVTEASSLPLSIDTSHVDIMEAALRRYPGRALINSVSLEEKKCRPLFKLAAKYGAMCILLPLSDKGIPGSSGEKREIINKLIKIAESYGLRDSDLVVDGLVGTVGANKNAAIETLDTISYCHDKLKLATVCGLSNISFGLPERIIVNSSFLTMAIYAGLTMAIANPGQQRIVVSLLSSDLLLGKKDGDTAYIEYMESYEGEEVSPRKEKKGLIEAKDEGDRIKDPIFDAVIKGKRSLVSSLVKEALEKGNKPNDILNISLLPAINKVGELFDKKKYFLPQLISSGEAMKNGVDILEPYLRKGGSSSKGAPNIVIGTVKGDIHDIGKNLVILMLKNHGFNVTDLGKDVSKEEFLEASVRYKADVIGMSALMTTTMTEMKNVIEYTRKKGYKGKYMVGGAVITDEYALEIGAAYSSDAADAVRVAKEILQMSLSEEWK
ncbi:MAG: homocysteine S-methyltransferase family protein [Lachnospiraceae bacterium]|nr:homocysteine S-methyltransferase family protein [Lachnospiraceae bacterium]